MVRSTSRLRAPMSRASTAPRRRRPAATTTAVSAAVVWRWSTWSLPLLLGFLCAGYSDAALRVVDASSSAAAAAATTTTTTTAATASTSDRTDPDTFTYESSWDSSPFNLQSVTENNLGLMAKACSQTYCHAGTSGLDLWVSLEEVCTPKAEPYLSALLVDVAGGAVQQWHPLTAGVLCGLTSLASMLLGFRWGTDYSTSHKGIAI